MKFGNLLRTCADDAPELENLFVCYKQLKKKLKHLPVQRQGLACGDASLPSALEERSFVQALNNDVLQFNDLFIEKEEESVIKLGDLEEQANTASTSEEIAQVRRSRLHFVRVLVNVYRIYLLQASCFLFPEATQAVLNKLVQCSKRLLDFVAYKLRRCADDVACF